jgi:hypothetical protein
MVNRCDNYKQFREYPLSKHNTAWAKWEDEIRDNWHRIIERNAELILFHEEWIEPSQIVCKKGNFDLEAVRKSLEEKGIHSLLKETK